MAIDFHARPIQNTQVSASESKASSSPRIFSFEQADSTLSLLPLCARRALDHAGIKIDLEAYQSLHTERRRQLAALGSRAEVDAAAVRALAAGLPATDISPFLDPPSDTVPEMIERALGGHRPLSGKLWATLSGLERYCLYKVSVKNRPDRVEAAYREIIGARSVSTHLKPSGGVHMVSISDKQETMRRARAESSVTMSRTAYDRLTQADVPKGDVLGTARLAGIMATKKTAEWIPLCHPLALQHVDIEFSLDPEGARLHVGCTVEVFARTGVEMEAMVGVSAAALTVYDMLKSLDRALTIGPTRLVEKTGGRSGHFLRMDEPEKTDR